MTVPSITSRVTHAGNGISVAFPVSFYFLANADLVVLVVAADGTSTTQVLNTNYTVTGAGNDAGGTVTMLIAPASGTTLIIYRDPAVTQLVDYAPNDPFPAETHERALDRLTMIAQRLKEVVQRSIRLPDSDTSGASTAIPAPVAGRSLKWSPDGLSLINSSNDPDADIAQASASADAAAASEAAALASELNAAASYDAFDDRYLGSKSADPALDNDGNAILTGALYWNTTTSKMKIFDGTVWRETATAAPASFTSNVFTGNAVTTAFSLSTTPASLASVFVFISGVAQRPTADYTIAGTTIMFTAAPPVGASNILVFVATSVAAGTPDDLSVSTGKIQDGAVTLAKLLSSIYGTSGANKLLQLDSGGKLPAVDGSQLANIGLKSGTAVASTSGTSIDFTGIPAWAKKITVMFSGVSTSGTSLVQIQLGAGSVTTTGYLSSTSTNGASSTSTTGFLVAASNAAADGRYGVIIISKITANTWVMGGNVGNATVNCSTSCGNITLSGTLDRIRITTVNGTDTFDAGSINIMWE